MGTRTSREVGPLDGGLPPLVGVRNIQQAAFRDNVLETAAYVGVTVLLCAIRC